MGLAPIQWPRRSSGLRIQEVRVNLLVSRPLFCIVYFIFLAIWVLFKVSNVWGYTFHDFFIVLLTRLGNFWSCTSTSLVHVMVTCITDVWPVNCCQPGLLCPRGSWMITRWEDVWKWSRDQDLRFEAARNLYAFMKIFDVLLNLETKKVIFIYCCAM